MLWILFSLLAAGLFLWLFGSWLVRRSDVDTPEEIAESRYHEQAQAEVEVRVAGIYQEMARRRAIPVDLPKKEKVDR